MRDPALPMAKRRQLPALHQVVRPISTGRVLRTDFVKRGWDKRVISGDGMFISEMDEIHYLTRDVLSQM